MRAQQSVRVKGRYRGRYVAALGRLVQRMPAGLDVGPHPGEAGVTDARVVSDLNERDPLGARLE